MNNLEKNKDSKKILFMGKYFFPALGGGEFFVHKILKCLKEKGFFVYSSCYCNPNDVYFNKDNYVEWDGIPVFQIKPDGDFIEKFIQKTNPDIVITQSFDAPRIVQAAKSIGAKTILGTHFWRNICDVDHSFTNMLTRDMSSVKLLKDKHKVFFNADQVYVNSKFMQIALERFTGFYCENIIHPIIDLERIVSKEKKEKKYITLINPDEGKGGDILIELANRLKGLNFLCVGKGNEFHPANKKINVLLSQLKNVKMVDSTQDMYKIYEETKILLIPSKVDETFSMVALEAMFNGIPVIASNYGNLPFLIDEAGFNLPIDNMNLWEECIDSLVNNSDLYCQISINCIERSKKYLPDLEMEKFIKLVSKCLENKI